ncbi:CRISPR system precrRNA processing endoribonuclease RAMP protein Cas6 [Anaerolinea sp.]|uniref:CRISPR system precrRNA processing endoribonuclease RAMP protein Cas6 n=1 Tax=Anaerolinea sp. TaxID=1872519 RepID=UPI002ACDEB8A|nr:CRISPR system precrRNA processing endoribonuclease RAMP protein Cas6 [Anaerolinea sp.]
MLTALVIELQSCSNGTLQGATGTAIHGFWLKHWKSMNTQLAGQLHDPKIVQPFTVSPLLGLPLPKHNLTTVLAGNSAWFRVTTLTRELSLRLREEWLPKLPPEVEIGGLWWRVSGYHLESSAHPWAGQFDQKELVEIFLSSSFQPSDHWEVHFETPTAFMVSEKISLPFPLPGALIASWLRRWQCFNPMEMKDIKERAINGLAVSAYDLKTIPARLKNRVEIGCIGNLSLKAINLPLQERRIVDLLSAYAFWAGSGHHTTQGFGMTCLQTRKNGEYAPSAGTGS